MHLRKYLFDQKTEEGTKHIGENIDFTLREVGESIVATGGTSPTSWSNFVLDLTRKKTLSSKGCLPMLFSTATT
jgi:hypothetical protein